MAAEESPTEDANSIPTDSLNVDPNKLFKWLIKETANVSYNNMPEAMDEEDDGSVTRLIDLDPKVTAI